MATLDIDILRQKHDSFRERCGFILKTGEVVEVQNIHPEPMHYFEVDDTELEKYRDRIAATWHTHIHDSANLSAEDYHNFLKHQDWPHYIISSKNVWLYYVMNNKVFVTYEDSDFPWQPKEPGT